MLSLTCGGFLSSGKSCGLASTQGCSHAIGPLEAITNTFRVGVLGMGTLVPLLRDGSHELVSSCDARPRQSHGEALARG